jgi:tetratricopeptide (TPR) repeat protein
MGDTLKKLHWLNLAEYASLLGVGVGTVATLLSRQALYATAPLSFMVLLNLANRRRFEEMSQKDTAIALSELDKKVSKHLELLNQQITSLPTPEAIGNIRKSILRKNREGLEKLAVEIKRIQQDVSQRIKTMEEQKQGIAASDLAALQNQYTSLSDALSNVTTHLQRLSDSSSNAKGFEQDLAQLRTDVNQVKASLQNITDQTRPTLTSLQDQINHLNRQFQKLPPPFDASALRQEVGELVKVVSDLVPRREWNALVAEVQALHRQQESLAETSDSLRRDLQSLNQKTKAQSTALPPDLADVKKQLAKLTQQVQELPAPFDPSDLTQRVNALVRIAQHAVPRKDWTVLSNQLKALSQQKIQQGKIVDDLRRELAAVQSRLNALPDSQILREELEALHAQLREMPDDPSLREELLNLRSHLQNFPSDPQLQEELNAIRAQLQNLPNDPTWQEELAHLRSQLQNVSVDATWREELEALKSQLQGIPTETQLRTQIEEVLRQRLREIRDQLQQVPPPSNPPLTIPQLHYPPSTNGNGVPRGGDDPSSIGQRVDSALYEESVANGTLIPVQTQEEFQLRIEETLRRELQDINRQLQSLPDAPQYEFVFDLRSHQNGQESMAGNRVVLEEALEQTQDRLILIWPWSNQVELDDRLMEQFNVFLSRNRQLDLGWCHLVDRTDERFLLPIRQRWLLNPLKQGELEETLQKLLHLKRSHPDHFRFKILGTIENFLVSDRRFAVLGIDNALITTTVFPDLELKLRTTDGDVIQRLVDRFDGMDVELDSVDAYWNRAVTRYDLGDKPGALADFDRIVNLTPDDAIAFNYRATIRYDLKDAEGAFSDLNQSLLLNPQQVAVYCNRGYLRMEQNLFEDAIADFSLAVWNKSDAAIAYFYRGMTYQKMGNQQSALADYTEAVRCAPDAPIAHYQRGMLCQRIGDTTQAIAHLEAAAQLFEQHGSHTNAQKAIAHLEKLQAKAS